MPLRGAPLHNKRQKWRVEAVMNGLCREATSRRKGHSFQET